MKIPYRLFKSGLYCLYLPSRSFDFLPLCLQNLTNNSAVHSMIDHGYRQSGASKRPA